MAWPSNQAETPEHLLESDREAGFEVTPDFKRFSQMNDMFTRAFWDETVRSKDSDAFFNSYRMEAAPRRGEGFQTRDFALRNAAWRVSDMVSERHADEGEREGFQAPIRSETPIAPEKVDLKRQTWAHRRRGLQFQHRRLSSAV